VPNLATFDDCLQVLGYKLAIVPLEKAPTE
jgi:hypothetical protein